METYLGENKAGLFRQHGKDKQPITRHSVILVCVSDYFAVIRRTRRDSNNTRKRNTNMVLTRRDSDECGITRGSQLLHLLSAAIPAISKVWSV